MLNIMHKRQKKYKTKNYRDFNCTNRDGTSNIFYPALKQKVSPFLTSQFLTGLFSINSSSSHFFKKGINKADNKVNLNLTGVV